MKSKVLTLFMVAFCTLGAQGQLEKKELKRIEKTLVHVKADTLMVSENRVSTTLANTGEVFGSLEKGNEGWDLYRLVIAGGRKWQYSKSLDLNYAQISFNPHYISQFEVSNKQYRDYVAWVRANEPQRLQTVLLDTQGWNQSVKFSEPFVAYYHSHPAYDAYPVVNVSHKQVVEYLSWLTNQYNSSPNRKFKKVKFRLPTEVEWMNANLAGRNYENIAYVDAKGRFTANLIMVNQATVMKLQEPHVLEMADTSMSLGLLKQEVEEDSVRWVNSDAIKPSEDYVLVDARRGVAPGSLMGGFVTTNVKSFEPNPFGIYNLMGNVAEFIETEGIAKGGHWNTTGYYAQSFSRETFDVNQSSAPTRGFRYVMEVIEE